MLGTRSQKALPVLRRVSELVSASPTERSDSRRHLRRRVEKESNASPTSGRLWPRGTPRARGGVGRYVPATKLQARVVTHAGRA
jgi:hypothetical protein